jgi:molybdopterin adenylyltransferase
MSSKEQLINHLVLQELIKHFQDRPQVQNIDVMNVAGFCRNCLAKWRHRICKQLQVEGSTYEQALEYVYGMPYDTYKKQYQTKATQEQLDLFKSTEQFHANHAGFDATPVPKSNVCCDEEGNDNNDNACETVDIKAANVNEHKVSSLEATFSIKIGIITLSDRASKGIYKDASGTAMQAIITNHTTYPCVIGDYALLPDDKEAITAKLREFSTHHDVILTTGGTGLSPRDVTPEATLAVMDRRVPGVSELLRRESAKTEPMAWLSRGESGMIGKCLVVNLPGRPTAAVDCTKMVLPLLPRVMKLQQ